MLVRYHELTFGEDFTKDTKDTYLAVSGSMITTVNGEETSAFSFAVAGEYPCDKNSAYTQYGYTGYTISQAPVAEDDIVEFFFYQDTSYYMDYYTWFTDADGNRINSLTVQVGTDFTLGMDGYMYAYGGSLKPEDRETHGAALDPENLQICTVGEDGTLTPVEGKTIGEDGKVTLSFTAAGSYVLSAVGDEYTDIVSPWLPVTVTVPKSSDAGVSSITVAGTAAKAGADNQYTVTVPYGTIVTADSFVIVTNHSGAAVGALTQNGTIWSFTVTAEDGVTTAVYTVAVATALPPYVGPAADTSKPAADARLPFTDVYSTSWFYNDAAFVYEKGLFSGTDSRSFSPDASMTRAMLVTVLYRLDGEPAVTGRSSFADVSSGMYYENAVIWAAANGIVTGTGSTSFSPDAKVTREQLAAILYRYAQYKKLDVRAEAKLSSFTDAASVSGYANAALSWAVAEGLVNGASGRLMPKGDATRAQVAAILHRFVENVMN